MYASIRGKVITLNSTEVIVELGGIGYRVYISLFTFGKIKGLQEVYLYTHLHVREDLMSLYGFCVQQERNVFLSLISVSGISVTTAQKLLSAVPYQELSGAILQADIHTLNSIKGIGKKTAERMVLELKDKLQVENIETASLPSNFSVKKEAIAALTSLGYNNNLAEKMVDRVEKNGKADLSVEQVIKDALKLV